MESDEDARASRASSRVETNIDLRREEFCNAQLRPPAEGAVVRGRSAMQRQQAREPVGGRRRITEARPMQVKTFNYKRVFSSFRLHDWSAPLSGTKMEDHISQLATEGWRMTNQFSPSKDMVTVTYMKD